MPGLNGMLKVTLCGMLLATCHSWNWWRRSGGVRVNMASSGPTNDLLSQRFACTQRLSDPINYFKLNVTLNTSAYLENPKEANLVQSSTDHSWHFLRNRYDDYPVGDLEVAFTLIYNSTPSGNCLFSFDKNEEDDDGSDETEPSNMTTGMTSFIDSTTPLSNTTEVEIETKTILQNISEANTTTIINTTPSISMCLCPCECEAPMSKDNADRMLAAILEDMRIPKSTTSFSKRKKLSATDHRFSSKSLGLCGAFVMTVVMGVIVIGDAKLFLRNARTAVGHIRAHFGI